jgi:hypothetical protein
MYNYVVIDNLAEDGHHEASETYYKLRWVLMVICTLHYVVGLRTLMHACIT